MWALVRCDEGSSPAEARSFGEGPSTGSPLLMGGGATADLTKRLGRSMRISTWSNPLGPSKWFIDT